MIAADETGWHTSRLHKALRARGALGRCVDLADCRIDTTWAWHGLVLPGYGRGLPDAVIVRGIAGGSFEQVTTRLGILHALQALGVPVYNSARGIECSVDKAMTSWRLHTAGVPTPPAWATEQAAEARRVWMRERAAGHALVMKPLFGSQGKGLVRLGEAASGRQADPMEPPGQRGRKPSRARSTRSAQGAQGTFGTQGDEPELPALAGFGQLAYLQRFVPAGDAPGHDFRVLVVGGRAVAAMKRVSAHWIHNIAQGARCVATLLTPELAATAEAAAAALPLEYAGVDLMPDPSSPRHLLVLEVNGVAAWRGLQRVTRFDIAQCLVDDLVDRVLPAARAAAAAVRAASA
jgi:glutathione synthase/RimK-type ligase-like ATP-grasp enzyme